MKRYLIFSFFLFVLLIVPVNAKNSISNINIDLDILENGDGVFREKWDVYSDSGSEIYKVLGNMDGYNLTNFYVTMSSGNVFSSLNNWNINGSFQEKSYKSGIYYDNNGDTQLCFGISKYGMNTYYLNYRINNFVKQYTDNQGIYFSFVSKNMDPYPNNVEINIKSNLYKFDNSNSSIYIYGLKNASSSYNDGVIKIKSNGSVGGGRYINLLIGFKDDVFNIGSVSSKSFKQVYNEASESKATNRSTYKSTFKKYDYKYIFFVVIFLIFIFFNIGRYKGTKKVSKSDILYYRDIPFNGDLEEMFWALKKYDMIPNENVIIGVYFLKWLRDGKISLVGTKDSKFDIDKGIYAIDFSNISKTGNKIEDRLIDIFSSIASVDKILYVDELRIWCGYNYSLIISWYNDFLYDTSKRLENDLYIVRKKVDMKCNNNVITREVVKLSDKLDSEVQKVVSLKKFLQDFSIIDQRSIMEIKSWDNYIIVAFMLGISSDVIKNLKEFSIDFGTFNNFKADNLTSFGKNISFSVYNVSFDAYNVSLGGSFDSSGSFDGNRSSNGSGISSSSGGISAGGFSSRGGGGIR